MNYRQFTLLALLGFTTLFQTSRPYQSPTYLAVMSFAGMMLGVLTVWLIFSDAGEKEAFITKGASND